MIGTRDGAMRRAVSCIDDGRYLGELATWIALPTESQKPERLPECHRFLTELVRPRLCTMGFATDIFDNPVQGAGPLLVARRMEEPSKPTLLTYGHGDVVTAFREEWRDGLDPWTLTEAGDRFYGRGSVDNKGQLLLTMLAQQAVAEERGGRLGFNSIYLVETSEERGSPGLQQFVRSHADLLAADLLVWCDGPRVAEDRQELNLGARGSIAFDLVVDLGRTAGLHSGHWGGAMPDAGIILAQAISTITTPKGRILVEGWLPAAVPAAVTEATRALKVDPVPGLPPIDPDWGLAELCTLEKVLTTTSFIVLAYRTGNPDLPVNAVPGYAKARCQIRHTVDVDRATLLPALRRHLDAHGFAEVRIEGGVRSDFEAWRTNPEDPWVRWAAGSIAQSSGQQLNILPNGAGSNPGGIFADALGLPAMKVPHSYKGCGMHGPNEHALIAHCRQGFAVMAGLYWDLGEAGTPAPKPAR